MEKSKHTSEGLGTSWAFKGDELVFSASSTSTIATWTVKLQMLNQETSKKKKTATLNVQNINSKIAEKNIREMINVPAVSAAVTVDSWTAFKDPTLVLRLKYLTGLWTNKDLWLWGICKLPDLSLLSSTAEILIFGTPRLPETDINQSLIQHSQGSK